MMNVVEGLDLYHKNSEPVVVALGNFDGVHKGHQEIFRAATKKANALNGHAWVVTFKEHPQHVLHAKGKPLILTSLKQRFTLFEEFGIYGVFLLNFTQDFSKTLPKEFVKSTLMDKIGARAICMGFNARFGANRSGDVGTMKEYSLEYGFDFIQVGSVEISDHLVSSSAIRELIWKGELQEVQNCLGREFSVYAKVIRGQGIASQIGFPTANLDMQSEVLPPHGVYLVRVNLIDDVVTPINSGSYRYQRKFTQTNLVGVLNYGVRPTVSSDNRVPVAEVHLIDWQGDLTGKTIEVRFLRKLRDEQRFADTNSLRKQIKDDIKQALDLIKK